MKPVYTLQDLTSRQILDAGADKPARLAVLGWPIAHSASPQMHQAALDFQGIDARYIRLAVEPGGIPEAFSRMRELGFIGCNVTVPHKFEALKNCTDVHPDALALGAVNTVRFDADGILGFNTDGPGFERAVGEVFGMKLAGCEVLIVGAGGGAGQAIATQCVLSGVSKLVLVNRTVEKLESLAHRLSSIDSSFESVILSLDDPKLVFHSLDCHLIVNTSSVGLKSGDPSILSRSGLRPGQWVYDTIYQPAVTPLLSLAADVGCHPSNGLSMLLHQGALAFQHWFPEANPLAVMRNAMV